MNDTDTTTVSPPRGAHVQKAQAERDEYRSNQSRIERQRDIELHRRLVPAFRPAGGTESKYDASWMPEKVYTLLCDLDLIFTKKLIAGHLGVAESTFRSWQSIYPELSASVAQGLAVQEAWLASQMARGMKYSASMYAVLKNLHEWKETVENTHKLGIGEALEAQKTGARRVDWDRSRPDPLAPPVIDAQLVPPASPAPTHTPPPAPTQ